MRTKTGCGGGRVQQIVRLVFDTIRETYKAVPVPMSIAKVLAMPREMIFRTVRTMPIAPHHHNRMSSGSVQYGRMACAPIFTTSLS